MKPKGHKDIASFYSVEVIKEAAKRLPLQPEGEPNTQAMLVSNWVTDVAQFIIPFFGVNQVVSDWIRGSVDVFFNLLYLIFLDNGRGQLVVDTAAKQSGRIGSGETLLKDIFDEWKQYLQREVDRTTSDLERTLNELGCDTKLLQNVTVDRPSTAFELMARIREEMCQHLLNWTGDIANIPTDLKERLQSIERQLQPVFSRLTDLAIQLELINLDDIQSRLETLRTELHASVDNLFPNDYTRTGELHELYKSLIFLIGYFKFVHPEDAKSPPRLPYPIFRDILKRLV